MRRLVRHSVLGVLILLTLPYCDRGVRVPVDSRFDPTGRTPLVSRGGLDRQSVEGGSVQRIRATAALGCTDLGIPANAVVATYGVAAAALSPGDDATADPAWYLVGTTPLNTAGKIVNTILCTPGQILVGSDKGLEWVSRKDLTSGTFSSTLFNGNGVSAIFPLDATHVLAGIQGAGGTVASGAILCDLTALTCSQAGAGMGAFSAFDQVLTFSRLPSGTILAGTYSSGIYRSTDGGQNWTQANAGITSAIWIRSFVGSGPNVFAAAFNGIYESTNDGQSWTRTSNGLGTGAPFPVGLAGNGTTMITAISSASEDVPATIWKTTNGAASWQQVGTGLTANTVGDLASTPGAFWAATNAGVFRSTDGGTTWTPFNRGLDNTAIYRVVSAGGMLFATTFANANGVFRSADGGATWQPANALLNNRRLQALVVVGGSVVASGFSGVYRSTDAGATFAVSRAGLPANASPVAMATSGGTIFAGLFPSGFAKSTDGGATWVPGTPPSTGGSISAIASNGSAVAAAAGNTVYRSTDGGATWTPGAVLVPTDPNNYFIYSLTFVGSTLYAGLQGFGFIETHGVKKSTDFGATWTPSQNGIPANVDVYDVQASGAQLIAGTGKGLYTSTDGGANWTSLYADLSSTSVLSVAVAGSTLHAGTFGRGLFSIASPAAARRMLPVVADVNTGSTRFTTDAAVANTGTTTANLTIQYTASLGSGSGTVTDTLSPGQQLIVPDVLAYLRGKGLSIPEGGQQSGTLVVTFRNLSDPQAAGLVARTTSATLAPQPVGSAGLAYPSVDPALGWTGKLRVYGLRQNAGDRSNVAVYNTSDVPVTVKVTVFSGDGSGASSVLDGALTLPQWGWKQYTKALQGPGFPTGWAEIERVSSSGSFGAYGVINDASTNDGSYIAATLPQIPALFLDIPVIAETSAFNSELVLTNASESPATFALTFTESLASGIASQASGRTPLLPAPAPPVHWTVPARSVQIQPHAVDWLRGLGAPVPPKGLADYAGSLHIDVSGVPLTETSAGVRTSTPSPAGGEFGQFMPARLPGTQAFDEGWVFGLLSDTANRSNLGVINDAATSAGGNVTIRATFFDGVAGGGTPVGHLDVTLGPGAWKQWGDVLKQFGVQSGYAHLERLSGFSTFDGYGSRNDGSRPGDRTGDGSYLPLTTRYSF